MERSKLVFKIQNDLIERFNIISEFLIDKELNYIELKYFFNSVVLEYNKKHGWHFQLMDPNSFFQCYFDFSPNTISSWSEEVIIGAYIATKNTKKQLDSYYRFVVKKNIRLEQCKNFIHNLVLRFFK